MEPIDLHRLRGEADRGWSSATPLTYSLGAGAPTGASINAQTGQVRGRRRRRTINSPALTR